MNMENSKNLGPPPDYENPPVVETILGMQFDRLPALKNAYLGVFWKTLGQDEWPDVSDAPALEMQFERFTEAAQWPQVGFQWGVMQEIPAPSNQEQRRHQDDPSAERPNPF